MSPSPASGQESRRLALLHDLGALSAPADPVFAGFVRAAALLTDSPMALISLVGQDRVHWLAGHGVELTGQRREASFCVHLLSEAGFFEVQDATQDARFAALEGVRGAPGVRFYAGAPLKMDGLCLGALCVVDLRPRQLSDAQRAALESLAAAVCDLLRERRDGQAQAQRLHDLARASGDWMWELGDDLRFRWIAGDFEAITGLSVSAMIGQPMLGEAGPDPVADAVADAAADSAAAPGTAAMSRAALSEDGAGGLGELLQKRQAFARRVVSLRTPRGLRSISYSGLPVFDNHGRFGGYRGTARDMTSQIKADEQIRAAGDRLHKLASQVPGALFQLQVLPDGSAWHYRYASDGLLQILGDGTPATERPEDHPHTSMRLMHPQDRPRVGQAIAKAMATLEPLVIEFRLLRPGEPPRWAEMRAMPERLDDGGVLFHGFAADISERRRMAQRLNELDALRREKSAAERASRSKSEFLSRASHELRTPLNAILGLTEVIAQDPAHPLPDLHRLRLNGVRHAGEQLLRLVDDMLDIARIQQGARALSLAPLSAMAIANGCLAAMAPLAAQRGVRLRAVVSTEDGGEPECADDFSAWADGPALRQILMNLLSNAIQYNRPDGQAGIELRRHAGRIEIAVVDEGGGLSADQLDQLFQPFNRLGAERRRIEGTGLGLVIAQGLAVAMGGSVQARSEPDRGSRFTVHLQAAAAGSSDTPAEPTPTATQAAAETSTPLPTAMPMQTRTQNGRRSSLCVLYVEDEALNVLLMQEVFKRQPGWTLEIARDGAEGVAMALQRPFDLALIDMNLPDFNGLEVLRRLRADATTAGLVCVALSADAMTAQIERALNAGFDDYWTKPIDLNGLLDAIARAVDRRVKEAPR